MPPMRTPGWTQRPGSRPELQDKATAVAEKYREELVEQRER